MQLQAKTPTENRLKEYLDANASDALREKIAALPDGERFNLSAAFRFIKDRAREHLQNKSGCIEDEVVFGWLIHYYEDVAPAEAAKPAAPAKAKEEAKTNGARKGASDRNRQPAARAGSSKSRTKGRGCEVPPESEARVGPSSIAHDGARAPSAVASSAPPPESARAGSDSPSTGGGAAPSPGSAVDREAAMAPAERAAESGFSFELFEGPAA